MHADETKLRIGEPRMARDRWVWTVLCENIVGYVFVDARRGQAVPKSPLGKAVEYAFRQRKELWQFLTDPKIPLDNNIAERALRVVAVGRKNYVFVGHAEAGQNLAVLQTICHTCLLHDVNPYEYIKDVLVRVSSHPASKLDELLPQTWQSLP
ncbi:MAG: transposase [Bradymonadia bacterium]